MVEKAEIQLIITLPHLIHTCICSYGIKKGFVYIDDHIVIYLGEKVREQNNVNRVMNLERALH